MASAGSPRDPRSCLPVRVLAKLFRRLFLDQLAAAARRGQASASSAASHRLRDRRAFLRHLAPLRKKRWFVYAKPPFAGPEAVLAYLARYTHRVAISNRRLIASTSTASPSATRTTAATAPTASAP